MQPTGNDFAIQSASPISHCSVSLQIRVFSWAFRSLYAFQVNIIDYDRQEGHRPEVTSPLYSVSLTSQ